MVFYGDVQAEVLVFLTLPHNSPPEAQHVLALHIVVKATPETVFLNLDVTAQRLSVNGLLLLAFTYHFTKPVG